MESRERIKRTLNLQVPDRVPRLEIGFWDETVERWRKEGLPERVTYQSPFLTSYGECVTKEYKMQDTFEDYFGLDRIALIDYDGTMRFKEEVLEETEEYKIYTLRDGLTNKAFKNKTSTPLQIDRKIKSKEDWDKYKCRLIANKDRIKEETIELCRILKDKDIFTIIRPEEPCQYALYLIGEEDCLIYMATDPDYIEEFIAYFTEFQLNMLEVIIGEGIRLDALWYFSDLCYKNGMLFSPAFYRERIMKYHKKIFSFCKNNDMNVIYHCDGNIGQLLPLLVESGIDCIQPIEARAGNDVRDYKKLYGNQIAFCGNISADVLSTDKAAIEKEISEKVELAKNKGGYIFHSDHSIPPSVSLENYCYAMELVKKYGNY